MKKTIKLSLLLLAIFTSLNFTFAYFTSTSNLVSKLSVKGYEISINGNQGLFGSSAVVVSNNKVTLPIPTRTGHTFNGYSNNPNGEVLYSNSINNINDINNNELYAIWEVNSYLVDVNPMIDSINYNSGLSGFTFDVWINDKLVADNVIDWCESVQYGNTVRVKTNIATGRNTNYDKTITIGASNTYMNPTWTTNTYEGHFYLNGVHRFTTYNKYGSTVSTPNTNAGALGYDSNFYYISGYTPWATWYQPDYAVGFTINIAEYNCMATFGSAGSNNATHQINKLKSAGYNLCYVSGASVVCSANYSSVIAVYNNAWNILPKSGNGYSIYKSMSCDSGWGIEQRR